MGGPGLQHLLSVFRQILVLEPARRLSGELMKIQKAGIFVTWNHLFHRLIDHEARPQTHKTQRVV